MHRTVRTLFFLRASLLVHLPEEDVERILSFVKGLGIVVNESAQGTAAYRIVHDVMADHILQSEEFSIKPLWRVGIEGLIEQRISERHITKIDRIPSLLRDCMPPLSITAVGVLLIYFFFFHGVATVTFEAACQVSLDRLSWLPVIVGLPADCPQYRWEHLVVMVPHLLWLWYIYDVTVGYLLRVTDGPLRAFVATMPSIGAALAIVCAHYPQLMTVPIGAVGLMLSVALIWGCLSGTFVGEAAKVNFAWRLRTLGNMVFSLLLTAVMIANFNDAPPTFAIISFSDFDFKDLPQAVGQFVEQAWPSSVSLIAFSVLMSYFWLHIFAVQQSTEASAARLAYHDRAIAARRSRAAS